MNEENGLWSLVVLSSAVMIAFAARLLHLAMGSLQRWPTLSTLGDVQTAAPPPWRA